MQNEQTRISDLEIQVRKLQADVDILTQLTNKNNFSSSQTFTKDVEFFSRMRVPVYTSEPDVGQIGDLIAVGGVLYICTTAGDVATPATFTPVGTQS